MIFIVRKPEGNYTHRHIYDVERIYNVVTSRGVITDLETCGYIWDEISDDYAAGWIGLPDDDDELYDSVLRKANRMTHIKGFET